MEFQPHKGEMERWRDESKNQMIQIYFIFVIVIIIYLLFFYLQKVPHEGDLKCRARQNLFMAWFGI